MFKSAPQFAPRQRSALIDFLRGLCLVLMTVNHMPRSPISRFTWQTFGFVSSAEGFVFLSGLVTGCVYGQIAISQGIRSVAGRSLRRVRFLYLTNAVFMTFAILAERARMVSLGEGFHASWSLWCRTIFLFASPGYSEILRLYCVLFLFIPAILWALINRQFHYVVAGSVGLWLLAFFGYGMTALSGSGYFDIVSWQLLFVAGICLGFFSLRELREIRIPNFWIMPCFIIAVISFLIRHSHFFNGNQLSGYFAWLWTWRRTLSLGRLVNFAALAFLIYRFRNVLGKLTRTIPGTALVFLGQHSLWVFLWSISASMLAYGSHRRWEATSSLDQILFIVLTVASCFIPAWLHTQWRALCRKKISGLRPHGTIPAVAVSV